MEIAYPLKFFSPDMQKQIIAQHPGYMADFTHQEESFPIVFCKNCQDDNIYLLEQYVDEKIIYSYRCTTCGQKGSLAADRVTAALQWGQAQAQA